MFCVLEYTEVFILKAVEKILVIFKIMLISSFYFNKILVDILSFQRIYPETTQSAGAVEYADYIFAES